MGDKERSINFVEGLSFFKGAPVCKLWLFLFILLTILRVYWNSTVEWAYIIRISDFWTNISIGDVILLLLSVDDFSAVVGQIGLIHTARLIERRFGSRKFLVFFLFISLICCPLFIYSLKYYTSYYQYNYKKIYIETLSETLFAAVFVQLIQEIPVVSYVRLFGLPISVHHLPIIFMIQIVVSSKFSFLSVIIGSVTSYIYTTNIVQKALVKLTDLLSYITLQNPTSIILVILYNLWDLFFNRLLEPSDEKLPIACTVEKQREELLDMYENEIIQQQLRHLYNNNPRNTNNPDGQLHYLNRMFRRDNNIQNEVETPIPEPPANAIQTLRDMGFTNEEEVREALRRFRNDVAQAANHLLNR